MLADVLLPKSLKFNEAKVEGEKITVKVTTTQAEAACPECGQMSQRVHSGYDRTVADLAWADFRVYVELYVRRLFCDNPGCQRKTFAERVPDFVASFARRSLRLATKQGQTALELGGQAGARLLEKLSMPTSGDTLLRLIKAMPEKETPSPRAVGIDDWAWCKGQSYGTIVVDLERHCPIDLLPDRSADSVADWLQQHPDVEIITRDRANEYIEGATRGAPQAQQVADRWHLVQNLQESLKQVLEQQPACLYAAANNSTAPAVEAQTPPQPELAESPEVSPPVLTATEQKQQATRQRRLARYQAVIELHQQGVGLRAIARQLDLGRRTVSRYIEAGEFPEMAQRPPKATLLTPYLPYLEQRWAEGERNGSKLYREIAAQNYPGCRSLVGQWVSAQRQAEQPSSSPTKTSLTKSQRPWSASYAVWLLIKEPQQLSAEEEAALTRMLQSSPDVARAYNFGQAFLRMMRDHLWKGFTPWLEAVTQCGLKPLQALATSLSRDKAAVLAALSSPWSNGQVEGQINRLKLIKRQMYGRAGFDLLRRRVLFR